MRGGDMVVAKSSAGAVQKAKARLQKHKGVRSEVVLEAALELFSREEYKAVTVQRIGQSIGITHSLIYYYYRNKENLFHSALVHVLDQVMEEINEIKSTHHDPVDLMQAFFQLNIDQSEALKRFVRIMFVNAHSNSTSSPKIVREIIRDFYALETSTLVDAIREGVSQGVFTCARPDMTGRFVSKCLDGIYYAALVRKDTDIAQAIRELEDVAWTLLNYEKGR